MKIRNTEIQTKEVEEKGLARFEEIRLLGRGAAGLVNLIRNKRTGD